MIWLDDVSCTGSESCLLSCTNRGIGSHNCLHSEDVAIYCSDYQSLPSTDCSSGASSKFRIHKSYYLDGRAIWKSMM